MLLRSQAIESAKFIDSEANSDHLGRLCPAAGASTSALFQHFWVVAFFCFGNPGVELVLGDAHRHGNTV